MQYTSFLCLIAFLNLISISNPVFAIDIRLLLEEQNNDAKQASAEKKNPVFTIDNIKINGSSNNLYNAKVDAVNSGIITAYNALIERILMKKDVWKGRNIAFSEISASLKNVTLAKERLTSTTYDAVATFDFDDEAIKRMLYSRGIFFINQFSDEYLVIPVLCNSFLCSTVNDGVWDDVWGLLPQQYGLLRLKYMLNDLSDESLVEYDKIINYQYNQFYWVFKRYKVSQAIIICAILKEKVVDVTIKAVSEYDVTIFSNNYNISDYETLGDLYKKLSIDAVDEIDSFYKRNLQKDEN